MHSCFLKWGLRLQNALGIFKVVILLSIMLSGLAALAGHITVDIPEEQQPHNFQNIFEGSNTNIAAFVNGLFK